VFILKIKKYFNKSPKKKKKLVNYYYFSTRPKILRSTNYQLPTQKKNKNIDHHAICACNSTKGSTIYSA
jgi:hypothetical protein